MWIFMVDDWAALYGCAANEHLRSYPNNGLLHFALDYCLTQGRCRAVTYGLSSIQEVNRAATLDYFKKTVGFEARPVHRAFLFHPLVRPLANPLAYWFVRGCSKVCPQSRTLRKAAGMLASHLGKPQPLDTELPVAASLNSQPEEDRSGEPE
jgi:hypothetical protein